MEYLARRAIFFITIIAGFSKVCVSSSVHKVGDAVGWTTIGNFDYRNWAAARVFHVHDTIGNKLFFKLSFKINFLVV